MPLIERVNFKAIHLIREHLAFGWSAEELVLNHPQLRLGEVYAALAWYADHASEVEAVVRESLETAEVGAADAGFARFPAVSGRPARFGDRVSRCRFAC